MSIFSIPNIKMAGLAACVPKQEEQNINYEWITPKERRLLIKTTGIEKRRIAAEGVTTADLCYASAQKLLTDLQWHPTEVGILVFISQIPDYLIPATSTILQHKLGLSKHSLAFDINLGCSGYVYGLSIVASLMKSTGIKKGLLLVGDVSSQVTSKTDKSTYPLFGDGGSATALMLEKTANDTTTMHFNLQSDGEGYNAIMIPDGGGRNPINPKTSFILGEEQKGICRHQMHLKLNGLDIFNFSLREIAPNIKKLLNHLDFSKEEVDYFIFHQANLLINETIRRKLKVDKTKVPYSLKEFGNTSSASIPITMVTALQKELQTQNKKLLLSGFGVGLSWGSCLLHINQITCCDLIEL